MQEPLSCHGGDWPRRPRMRCCLLKGCEQRFHPRQASPALLQRGDAGSRRGNGRVMESASKRYRTNEGGQTANGTAKAGATVSVHLHLSYSMTLSRLLDTTRSSNRTCPLRASGFPIGFIAGSRSRLLWWFGGFRLDEPVYPKVSKHFRSGEACSAARLHLVPPFRECRTRSATQWFTSWYAFVRLP